MLLIKRERPVRAKVDDFNSMPGKAEEVFKLENANWGGTPAISSRNQGYF